MSLSNKQIKAWLRKLALSSCGGFFLGAGVLFLFVKKNYFTHLLVFIEFWALSIASLYFLSKLAADLIRVMTVEGEKKVDFSIGTVIWGFLKVATLGITVWRMTETNEEFGLALALGVGTLFMVPMSSALMHKWKRF